MQPSWETAALLVAVLGPLVGVPMSAMTFYLRAIRDQQEGRCREGARRLEELARAVEQVERDYTTREEWLRESMLARQQLERLTEMVARVQVRLEDGDGLIHHLARASDAMLELARGLTRTGSGPSSSGLVAASRRSRDQEPPRKEEPSDDAPRAA